MPISYMNHGGNHQVAVVYCPTICGERLVHLSQDGQDSWVIRDYISHNQLRRSPSPNANCSTLSLAQIEAEVLPPYDIPPFHAWENIADWEAYLRLRTMVLLNQKPAATPPNSNFGTWKQL